MGISMANLNESAGQNSHTFSKNVSGREASNTSLQYMKKSPVAFSTARLNESAEQNSLTSQFGYTFSKNVSG